MVAVVSAFGTRLASPQLARLTAAAAFLASYPPGGGGGGGRVRGWLKWRAQKVPTLLGMRGWAWRKAAGG